MEAEPGEIQGDLQERDERVRGGGRRHQGHDRSGRRGRYAYHWTFTAKYNGKDSPVTGDNPFGDTIAVTRVNPNTVKISAKKDGKETVTQTIVVAADGKTRTTTTKGKDSKGKPVDGMSFYEKQ